MLINLINICNLFVLLYCSIEKKKTGKVLKKQKLGQTQNEAQIFLEITKGDYKLSRTFYFIKKS